jgi:predicted transcriptional regulator
MTLAQIQHALGLGCLTPGLDLDREVTSAHASDLLSDALANAPAGGVLLTIQVHLNVVAVALHSQQAAVIFTWGMQPDETVVRKAMEEGLPLFAAAASTFEIAGELYALGVRGAPAGARPEQSPAQGKA